jgi:large subunit ribosomal protein L23
MNQYDVLRRPILTEKADVLTESRNQYVFEVAAGANKRQIRQAVEGIFNVTVTDVHTLVMPGKTRRWGRHISRTPRWKKAIVTLASGQKLALFE